MTRETQNRTTLVDSEVKAVRTKKKPEAKMCLVRVLAPRIGLVFDAFTIPPDGLAIGRNPPKPDDVVIEDHKASRRHAEIRWIPDSQAHALCDLKSTNGTFLNQVRVDRDFLAPGDVVRVGNSLFVYCAAPSESAGDDEVLIGRSAVMTEVIASIRQVAPTDLKVLVTGETGTGKELAARALHRASRRKGTFVPVNCGSFPATLIESELFGHTKGAFSGADRPKEGLIVSADAGTLFLDEVGELPLDLQPRLLRVLQDHEVRPVGATASRHVDVRVVAATNQDVHGMVQDSSFRRDLLARLNEWPLSLPPLRDRKEDQGLLIRHFLTQRGVGDYAMTFDPDLLEQTLLAQWPGNVRELGAAIARVAVSVKGGERDGQVLLRQAFGKPPKSEPLERVAPGPPARAEDLQRVITLFDGNISGVARYYGKERQQVYRWMERFGLAAKEPE